VKKALARTRKPAPHHVTRGPLDQMFFWLVTFRWSDEQVAEYPLRLGRHNEMLAAGMTEAFQQIDTKATGLLAHVSLMIAGLGLVAPLIVDSEFEKGVVLAEIGLYLLIAVGCLRCLAVFKFREFGDTGPAARDRSFNELILRRELYGLCNRVAIYVTIAVFLLLPFLYFYKPGRPL
jgi:hypothetical protein